MSSSFGSTRLALALAMVYDTSCALTMFASQDRSSALVCSMMNSMLAYALQSLLTPSSASPPSLRSFPMQNFLPHIPPLPPIGGAPVRLPCLPLSRSPFLDLFVHSPKGPTLSDRDDRLKLGSVTCYLLSFARPLFFAFSHATFVRTTMTTSTIALTAFGSVFLALLFAAIAYLRYRVCVSPPATDSDGFVDFVAMTPTRRTARPDTSAPRTPDDTSP